MRIIKNFFYNINDLIVVVIILAAAAILIYWRINIILDYPEQILDTQNTSTVVEDIESAEGDVTPEEVTTTEEEPEPVVEEEPEPVVEEEAVIAAGSVFKNGKLKEDTTVEIEGGSATVAASSLVESNFFDDYAQYATAVESFDRKPENIKAGTYSFREGTSLESIIKAITF